MDRRLTELIEKLESSHHLEYEEYLELLQKRSPESASVLAEKADQARRAIYGNQIFIRGLIEISNICKNDCLYCGIRRSNRTCERYHLTEDEILSCCNAGYRMGFRTFVLQGGEDGYFTDERMCRLIRRIKQNHPDCAVTLSLGERSRESYEAMYLAGADRYLLRHETADEGHYQKLHPAEMSHSHRLNCLKDLKEIGYQVGCGFMVGSPYQTLEMLAKEMQFIEEFHPHMCGIGPFIPHNATPFATEHPGTLEMTCYLLSIIRLIQPDILLPSTTALGTIHPKGREAGILAGGNVVMPNLSPQDVRKKYELYNNKISSGAESASGKQELELRMQAIGYKVVTDRGDHKSITKEN